MKLTNNNFFCSFCSYFSKIFFTKHQDGYFSLIFQFTMTTDDGPKHDGPHIDLTDDVDWIDDGVDLNPDHIHVELKPDNIQINRHSTTVDFIIHHEFILDLSFGNHVPSSGVLSYKI